VARRAVSSGLLARPCRISDLPAEATPRYVKRAGVLAAIFKRQKQSGDNSTREVVAAVLLISATGYSRPLGGSLRRHVRHCHPAFRGTRACDVEGNELLLCVQVGGQKISGAPWLATEFQAADQFMVLLDVPALEVIEQAATLRDHLEQSAPRVIVFLVRFEMLGELVDALGKQRDLHLRRPGIALVRLVRGDDLFLRFSI
jgi:hypothetical protein